MPLVSNAVSLMEFSTRCNYIKAKKKKKKARLPQENTLANKLLHNGKQAELSWQTVDFQLKKKKKKKHKI